jgi:O-antigen ligase
MALVFLTPLIMYHLTSEIFEFNKMMFIYITTIVIVFLYLVHLFFCKERFKKHIFFIFLFIFVLSQILSTIFSIDRHTSFFGYYGRWNGGLLSIFAYTALLMIFVQLFTRELVYRLLKVSLLSSFVVILFGLPGLIGYDLSCGLFTGDFSNSCWTQEFNPAVRMFSTVGQPNWLGAYLAFHMMIGLYFIVKNIPRYPSQKKLTKIGTLPTIWIIGIYLILNSIALFYTKSRSAWLAVLGMCCIGLLILLKEYIKLSKRSWLVIYSGILALVVIAIGIFVLNGSFQRLISLPQETTQITDSFEIRKVVWKGALDLGNRYPLFGSGVETFAYAYYFTRPFEHNLTSEWDFIYNKAHNEFFNYLATTGYIGLLSYVSLIVGTVVLCIIYIRKMDRSEEHAHENYLFAVFLILAYGTIQITNFFGFSISIMQLLFYFVPGIYIVMLLPVGKKDHGVLTTDRLNKLSMKNKAGIILLLGCFIFGIIAIFRYYQADKSYALGRAALESDQNQEAIARLQRALFFKYEHVYEDKLSSALANYAFEQSLEENEGYARSLILLSEKAQIQSQRNSPENILYLRTKSKNYYMYYQINQDPNDLYTAVQAMEQSVDLAPSDVQTHYTLAIFYWIVSQEVSDTTTMENYLQKTKNTLREVIRMKPNYVEAQELLNSI